MHKLILVATLLMLLILGTQAVYAQYDVAGPLSVSSVTPDGGDVVTVSGSGYKPGSEVNVTLESTPVLLATTTVDDAGSFDVRVTIPATVTGTHTLKATGIAPDGSVRVLAAEITVDGDVPDTSSARPATKGVGTDTIVLGFVAVGVLLVSTAVLLAMGPWQRKRPQR